MRIKARKRLLLITTTLTLIALLNDPGLAQTRRKVMVAYVAPGITQAIPWIAKEAGIFTKHGIDAEVILLTGSPRLIQTLIAGDIDYALGGVSSVLRARIRGADPVIVAGTTNFTSQRVLVRPGLIATALAGFKGQDRGCDAVRLPGRHVFSRRLEESRAQA